MTIDETIAILLLAILTVQVATVLTVLFIVRRMNRRVHAVANDIQQVTHLSNTLSARVAVASMVAVAGMRIMYFIVKSRR